MQIRLTVTRTQGSRQTSADVLVTAEPGATLSSVAQQLRTAAGVSAPGRLFAGLDPLEDEAPLGRPLLVDGARLWLDVPGTPATLIGNLALYVVSGPDAGGVHLLTPKDDGYGGELPIRVGRGADADIRVDDPDISRIHAELLVRHEHEYTRVYVRDLGSTNGMTLDGAQVGGAPVEMRPGSLLRMGESSIALSVEAGGVPDLPVHPDGSGHVSVGRVGWGRGPADPPQVRIDLPPRPTDKGRPASRRTAMEQYERERADADRRIAGALTAEARIRREAAPDPATLLVSAVRPDARLWERRPGEPDFLRLRLGTGALPSNVTVVGGKAVQPRVPTVPVTVDLAQCGVVGLVGPRPELARLARYALAQVAGAHSPKYVEIVMIAPESAAGNGATAGEENWRWTRWLPHLIPEDDQDCSRLLGLGPEQARARLTELVDRIRQRTGRTPPPGPGETSTPDSGRAVVLVVDPIRALTGSPELNEVLTEGPAAGVFTLCLAERPGDLPAQTGAMVTLGGEVNSRLRVDAPHFAPVEGAVADMVSVAWADRFARALAPLRDRTDVPTSPDEQTRIDRVSPTSHLPEQVRLLELLGLELLTPAKLSARWDAHPATPRIALGRVADGPLAAEPAHVLIGGDAGSGVSEMVRAVVAGQAATNHPDTLDIALVSAGPGKPLASCEDLPHVFEYVDASAVGEEALERLVRRLEYELDQREWPPEHEDSGAGFGGTPGSPSVQPMPSLSSSQGGRSTALVPVGVSAGRRMPPRILLAVDNLTALAAEHPAFVEALAGLADRGRRFGLRIVLGASVIETAGYGAPGNATGERAFLAALNAPVCLAADLRVAMQTSNPEASRLVLGAGAATAAPGGPYLPGRAQAKLPSGAVVPFQAAGIGVPMASSASLSNRPMVRIQDWHELGDPVRAVRARRDADSGPTDLTLLIGALKKAVE
ncbi:FHA domain-containing protein [Catenulispora sp. NL8]|uniref:FHA domain-containing protein n=1 Tax=Catenulispora pinistramenti TaxID=2705254 RepID=A0ABS5KKI9_9ACTN|nr:FHA domain-containing protein [Catenulispora pinistramenti]MBS2546261.1 FHA domain-containing protein [Catenulispora pinistramenti]